MLYKANTVLLYPKELQTSKDYSEDAEKVAAYNVSVHFFLLSPFSPIVKGPANNNRRARAGW